MDDYDGVEKRMSELCGPIDMQIMMCDDRKELLMLACVMMQRVMEILDQEIGIEGRKQLFKDTSE